MPFTIETSERGLQLVLTGSVTARHACDLYKRLSETLPADASVTVHTGNLEDIDTAILQLLLALRKTASAFAFQDGSQAFMDSVERCAMRRELLAGCKEFV